MKPVQRRDVRSGQIQVGEDANIFGEFFPQIDISE